MRTKILVTGGKGFIGSNLVKELKKNTKLDVVVYLGNLREPIRFENVFSYIFHFAANTDTRDSTDEDQYHDNVCGFINLLEFLKRPKLIDKSKLVWSSSAAVLGNGKGPLNAYAHSKLICEEIANRYPKLDIVTLRFFNVFGPGEIQKGKMASMITRWALQIQRGEKPKAFENEKAKRDHVYVKDVVSACISAMNLKNGIYDVGSGSAVTFDRVLDLVKETLQVERETEWIKNPYKETYQTLTKAKLNWGWKPKYSLESGIADYLNENFSRFGK